MHLWDFVFKIIFRDEQKAKPKHLTNMVTHVLSLHKTAAWMGAPNMCGYL